MNRSLLGLWRRLQRRLGHYGIAAVGLALSALAMGGWALQLNADEAVLRQRALAQRSTAPDAKAQTPFMRPSMGQQMDLLVASFPPLSQSPADLKAVFKSASRSNIRLLKGDYQFKNDSHGALVVLSATFPLSATYGTTKEFAADVLRAVPNASMDELRMERSAANVSELESSIRFSFAYRRP
jgi:hypothetical protein